MKEEIEFMSSAGDRIPDDVASKILAEAARLNIESSKGYSLQELEQAGLEVQISPETIRQAVKIVEESQRIEQEKRQRARNQLKQKIKQYTLHFSRLRIGYFIFWQCFTFVDASIRSEARTRNDCYTA